MCVFFRGGGGAFFLDKICHFAAIKKCHKTTKFQENLRGIASQSAYRQAATILA